MAGTQRREGRLGVLFLMLLGSTPLLLLPGCPAAEADGEGAGTPQASGPPTEAPEEAPEFLTQDMWYGVYIAGDKVGYQNVSLFPDTVEAANQVDRFLFAPEEGDDVTPGEGRRIIPDTYEGDQVQAMRAISKYRMQVMATTVETDMELLEYLAPDGTVLGMVFSMGSADMGQRLFASFYPDRVDYVQLTPQGRREDSLEIPEGTNLVDAEWGLNLEDMPEGESITAHSFIPVFLNIMEFKVTAGPMEEIEFDGETISARRFRVEEANGLLNSTMWVDDTGEPAVIETDVAGIRMVREPAEEAKTIEGAGSYVPPVDLLTELQVNVDEPVEKPREARHAQWRISGIAKKSMVLSDDLQTVSEIEEQDDGTLTALYDITTQEPPDDPLSLPIEDEELAPFLDDTTYIQSDDAKLIDLAAEIVGEETNSWKAAQAIARWVSLKMRTRKDIGLVRSSLEVLDSLEGVCRDYAVLYAGLARAAGIPTRYVGGIVYWKTSFFYHAWNEVWVGKWVAIDTTAPPGYPVDATHIKFAEGNVSSLVEMMPAFGKLSIEVLDIER